MTTSTEQSSLQSAGQQRREEPAANTVDSAWTSPSRLGFWVAILTAICALAALAIGMATPAHSGPYCSGSCITYPYTNVASFVPRDYLWMYPAVLVAPLFVVLMTCVHRYVREDRKVFSQIGLSFASISAALIVTDYAVQLASVQPSLLKGETEGLSLFSMYNPHGIFIALEDAGYLMLSVAFLCAGLAFVGRTALERILRWLFIISSLVAIGALIGLALAYGKDLDYRFEVTVLTIDWTVLIVAGALLGVLFRRTRGYGSP
jgi:hypothetical protein